MSNMDKLKYIVKDCVLIKHEWKENTSNLIQVYNRNMDVKQNFITNVVKVNYNKDKYKYHNLKEGDLVFLSRYVNSSKKHKLDGKIMYSNVPLMQVMGVFRDNKIDFDTLEILDDKVLMEEVKNLSVSMIQLPDAKEGTVGRVLKVGQGGYDLNGNRKKAQVKEGDLVLFWNNITTTLNLNAKTYLCTEDQRIVGIFKDGIVDIDHLELLENRVLFEDAKNLKLNEGVLFAPEFDPELETTSMEENKFKVVKISDNPEGIKAGDTVLIGKDFLDYVDFKGIRYYTMNNISYIYAVLG